MPHYLASFEGTIFDYRIIYIYNLKDNCSLYIYMLKLNEDRMQVINVQMMNGQDLM